MTREEEERRLIIVLAKALGTSSQYRKILTYYPNLKSAIGDKFTLLPASRLRSKLEKIQWQADPRSAFAECTYLDANYPPVFRDLSEPPLAFWYAGNTDLLGKQNRLSIVGSRKITPLTTRYLHEVIPQFVRVNLVTVSGLAYGVDACVHELTLKNDGKTIGVLGNGLDQKSFSPKTLFTLAQEIISCQGLILSEYPEGTLGARHTFPRRNRLVAALSPVTLVAQAAQKSGSLITAKRALEMQRIVVSPSVEYFTPSFAGNRELIAAGARVSVTGEDIVQAYPELTRAPALFPAHSKPSGQEEVNLEQLCLRFGLPEKTALSRLTELELSGKITETSPGKWLILE